MPEAVLNGAMLPFGGHKGSAIALMIELIAGPLIGDLTSRESIAVDSGQGTAPLDGELILAIDPSHFPRPGHDGPKAVEDLFAAITGRARGYPRYPRYAAARYPRVWISQWCFSMTSLLIWIENRMRFSKMIHVV